MITEQDVLARLSEVCATVHQRYGIDLSGIEVTFDLRGRSAGQCRMYRNPTRPRTPADVVLRFNREMFTKNPEHLLQETVPHEVAHAVNWLRGGPNGHGLAWKSIAGALGCKGERCHDTPLTKARRVRKYVYVLASGLELRLTATKHKRLQAGSVYMARATCERITPEHYVREVME